MPDAISFSFDVQHFCSLNKKQKNFYMKHIQFTIQFVVLLFAIPIFMYAEFVRDDKAPVVKKQPESETSYKKTPVKNIEVLYSTHMLLN